MAQTKVFTIQPDGTASGLHYDEFDLGFLGKKEIGRASEILFDEDKQTFYVELPQLQCRFAPVYRDPRRPWFLEGFPGYDQARKFEVMILETCAWSMVEPAYAADFYALGTMVRRCFDDGQTEPFKWVGEGRGI